MQAFAQSLQIADVCVITDVYSAGEQPLADVSAKDLLALMHHSSVFTTSTKGLIELLGTIILPEDVMITLGAGDVTHYGPLFLDFLKSEKL
jgi:UDP-N-acetylmuramate--alanine ligase